VKKGRRDVANIIRTGGNAKSVVRKEECRGTDRGRQRQYRNID